jgi:hypothetical protein
VLRCESTDARARAQRSDPIDAAEPIENTDPTEPTEPTESAEPTDPTDRKEPLEAIDMNDCRDQSESPSTERGVSRSGTRRELGEQSAGSASSREAVLLARAHGRS